MELILLNILQILLKGGCRLLEPIMSIDIVSPSDRMSQILADLAKRRATILNVGSKGEFNKASYPRDCL